MGIITRNFANNLTTSGILKPSAFNNDSFDNVTSIPTGSVDSGSLKFISSQTASSANIEFTTGLDSTYKEYIFYFNNIHVAGDGDNFQFNLSSDGGTNYNVTKTTSNFRAQNSEGGSTLFSYNTGRDEAQSTGDQVIGTNLGTGNDEALCGYLKIFDPSSTTYVKHFVCTTQTNNTNNISEVTFVAGYANTTSAINAVKFLTSANAIQSGDIVLYGIN